MVNLSSDYGGFGSGFFSDHSTLLLLFANFIMIFFAIYENWNLLTIMFIYWCQSVIIGIFTFFKILNLKNFSTEGMKFSNIPALPTTGTKIGIAFFFLFHYGFFHFGYLLFLIVNPFFNTSSQTSFTDLTILFVVGIFFINHLFSFLYNREKDSKKKQNIGKVMMFPYIRIVPMHLTIIFGSFFIMAGSPQISLILFLILKTIADIAMHIVEHRATSVEKIQISLNKTTFSPGEIIIGNLSLKFIQPIKARSLKIIFLVEKRVAQPSRDGPKEQGYEMYRSEKILSGEKEYSVENYNFQFQIPQDIKTKLLNWKESEYFVKTQKIIESLGLQSFVRLQAYDKFFIEAKLDMPLGLDISKRLDIQIN